jgi:polyphosphate kinase 2 (PPK2 family)
MELSYISKEEQKKRLQARIEDPSKHWKISESDLQDRINRNKYMASYEETLSRFRNWAIAQIIVNSLERMKLKFPDPKIDVSRFIIE